MDEETTEGLFRAVVGLILAVAVLGFVAYLGSKAPSEPAQEILVEKGWTSLELTDHGSAVGHPLTCLDEDVTFFTFKGISPEGKSEVATVCCSIFGCRKTLF